MALRLGRFTRRAATLTGRAVAPARNRALAQGAATVQTRSFLTDRPLSSYWMRRAKVAQIVWRTVVNYPSMHDINEPNSALSDVFSPDAGERDRMFMYLLSLLPTDGPVDLHEFREGAGNAALFVYEAMDDEDGVDPAVVESIATPECIAIWNKKAEQLRAVVGAKEGDAIEHEDAFALEIGLSEINFSYADVKRKDGNKPDTAAGSKAKEQHSVSANGDIESPRDQDEEESTPQYSKFYLHESMKIKVKFVVREHIVVKTEGADEATAPIVVDTSFAWTFASNVSRDELIDWMITEVTPFESKLVTDDDSEKTEDSKKEDSE